MEPFQQAIIGYAPRIGGALTILFVGVILALVARLGTTRLLTRLQFDQVSDRVGLTALLRQGGTERSSSNLAGTILFYSVLVLALMAALGPLGFGMLATRLDQIVLFVPRVIAAIIVLILGTAAGGVLAEVTGRVLAEVGMTRATAITAVLRIGIMVIAAILAAALVNIDVSILINIVAILLGGITLAAALALGLGVRPLSQNIAASRYVTEGIAEGDTITIAGYTGTVERIGYAQTIIRSPDGRRYIIPHSHFMEHVVQQVPEAFLDEQ